MHPWLRTLLSLMLYVFVYYLLFRDIRSIALLVLVIVIHEAGHYIAMRAYGYRNVRMLFVPMFGAFVSGSPLDVNPARKLVVLFAGPLPGILLGVLSGVIYSHHGGHIFYLLSLMFILLNLFNLIPITPMDGGQILQTMFPRAARWVQTMVILTFCALIYIYLRERGGYIWLLLVLLLASRLFSLWKRREQEVQNETEPHAGLSWNERTIFLAVWLAAFLVPMQTLYRIL